MPFFKRKQKSEEVRVEPSFPVTNDEAAGVLDIARVSTKDDAEVLKDLHANVVQVKAPMVDGVAMDSCATQTYQANYGAVNIGALNFLSSAGSFIGYTNMAFLSSHWLLSKACSLKVRDASKKWYEISVSDEALTAEQIKLIEKSDKSYKLKKNVVEAVKFNNVFGIRHVLYKHTNPDFDYSVPFNPDSWGVGEYAGMAQIDPEWIIPEIDSKDLVDPTRIDFYEPTFWNINGKRYHKSHFVILKGDEVPDVLKPTYRYGGISKIQQSYERCYAAERSANEAPQLLMTKRLISRFMNLEKTKANASGLVQALADLVKYRDNYGVNVVGKDEQVQQLETSLTDVDAVIKNQYQIVCAILGIPESKLMGTGHGGLGTGETDEDYYLSEVEQLQGNECEEIIRAHYARLGPTFIKPKFGVEPEIELNWRPLKVMSAKERAEVNNLNANTDLILDQLGYIDRIDGAKRLAADVNSGYTGMELPTDEEPENGYYEDGEEYGAQENEQ